MSAVSAVSAEAEKAGFRYYDAVGNYAGGAPFPPGVIVDDYIEGILEPDFPNGVYVVEAFGKSCRVDTPTFPVGSHRERRFLKNR